MWRVRLSPRQFQNSQGICITQQRRFLKMRQLHKNTRQYYRPFSRDLWTFIFGEFFPIPVILDLKFPRFYQYLYRMQIITIRQKKKNENSKRIGKGEKKGTENENERSGKRIRKIQRPLSLGFMSIESIACPSIEIYDKGFPGIFSMENSWHFFWIND